MVIPPGRLTIDPRNPSPPRSQSPEDVQVNLNLDVDVDHLGDCDTPNTDTDLLPSPSQSLHSKAYRQRGHEHSPSPATLRTLPTSNGSDPDQDLLGNSHDNQARDPEHDPKNGQEEREREQHSIHSSLTQRGPTIARMRRGTREDRKKALSTSYHRQGSRQQEEENQLRSSQPYEQPRSLVGDVHKGKDEVKGGDELGDKGVDKGGDGDGDLYRLVNLVEARAYGRLPLPLAGFESAGDGDGDGDSDRNGQCDGQWVKTHITPSQYTRLVHLLRNHSDPLVSGYFRHILRYDYDPQGCLLILRLMTTAIHEIFEQSLVGRITSWISRIATGDQPQTGTHYHPLIRTAAAGIISGSHTHVTMAAASDNHSPDLTMTKSPDGQFHYTAEPGRHRYPPFVMEIAYSQKNKDLPALAKQYYEGTDGAIKTVLTVDLEYTPKGTRKARQRQRQQTQVPSERQTRSRTQSQTRSQKHPTAPRGTSAACICLYQGNERTLHNRQFRSQDGHVQHGSLSLSLCDFLPDTVVETLTRELQAAGASGEDLHRPEMLLDIGFEQLCVDLAAAERRQDILDKTPTPPPLQQPSGKKRVNWALSDSEDDDDAEGAEEETQGASARSRSRSASSKRRRLSTDERAYAAPRRGSSLTPSEVSPAALPQRKRTRSQTRSQACRLVSEA